MPTNLWIWEMDIHAARSTIHIQQKEDSRFSQKACGNIIKKVKETDFTKKD